MDEVFRMVCAPAALATAPTAWSVDTLRNGDIAWLADDGGLEAIFDAAHRLDLIAISIIRREQTADAQEQTVISFAGSFPLVWIAGGFSEHARQWSRDRGPMTLLVECDGPIPDDERARIGRFLALLERQTE